MFVNKSTSCLTCFLLLSTLLSSKASTSNMSTTVKEESIDIDDDAGGIDPVSCHFSILQGSSRYCYVTKNTPFPSCRSFPSASTTTPTIPLLTGWKRPRSRSSMREPRWLQNSSSYRCNEEPAVEWGVPSARRCFLRRQALWSTSPRRTNPKC